MKKAKEISKDVKLSFALDFMEVQKQYQKTKKKRNFTNIATAIVASFCVVAGLASYVPVALGTAIFGSMILMPSMYVFNSKMKEIIDDATHSTISYRQFKKLERSGELSRLLEEAKEMQNAPIKVGIERITPSPYAKSTFVHSSSKHIVSSNEKKNDGRNS